MKSLPVFVGLNHRFKGDARKLGVCHYHVMPPEVHLLFLRTWGGCEGNEVVSLFFKIVETCISPFFWLYILYIVFFNAYWLQTANPNIHIQLYCLRLKNFVDCLLWMFVETMKNLSKILFKHGFTRRCQLVVNEAMWLHKNSRYFSIIQRFTNP